jgi:hypothetical protein|tara:strand:+ start:120 stop:272 length:153 start_codon:yes stop_codon:yes gene_type:complete
MSISDIKMYAMSFGVVGITTFGHIETWLKITLLLVTIGYTVTKWVKLKKK